MENFNYDKKNGSVAFRESDHKYFDLDNPQREFTSVTTMIHSFTQPFDKDFWSAYKALEKLLPSDSWMIEKKSLLASKKFDKALLELHGISELDFNKEQQGILDAWDEENRKSCERGTKIHAELENSFYKKGKGIDLKKYQIGGTFECKKDYNELNLEHGVYPEYLIYYVPEDSDFCLAGQIDLLVKNGNHITIGDWKGLPLDTEIPTVNGWSTIKDLKEGDFIYDKLGLPTKIIHKSEVHHNPCYKLIFSSGESIVADHEHRWEVIINDNNVIMTTEEIANYLKNLTGTQFPKIGINKSLKAKHISLPVSPYWLGYWLGTKGNIIKKYLLAIKLGILKYVKSENLLKNKFIPLTYQRASYIDRRDLLEGFLKANIGCTVPNCIVIDNKETQLIKDCIRLVASQGKQPSEFTYSMKSIGIHISDTKDRNIIKVIPVETVPTQCLEVDSPTHTFLCTDKMIVTHNTNKKIETKSFYNARTKSSVKMQYPLNSLDDVNYSHYNMQLSTYAWMMQQLNPDFIIDDLVLVHFDHQDKMTVYHMPYLKDEVTKMISYCKKQYALNKRKSKYTKIEY